METTIQLALPEDFTTLCNLYTINPQDFIQSFVNQVSLPRFYSYPLGSSRWATYFFLDYIENEDNCTLVDRELESKYLTMFNEHIINAVKQTGEISASEAAGRNILKLWLRDVIIERGRYLTENLD